MSLLSIVTRPYFVKYPGVNAGERLYFVDYARDVATSDRYTHGFCGPHEVPGAWCPNCGDLMPFLAAIANDCLDPRGFVGEFSVQAIFHYCRSCHVGGVFQTCD